MTYEEARAYLDDIDKTGIVLGLESMGHLLEELGNPQDRLKFIHIAGTNGKGSVLAYVSTILKEAGHRVGRYISPTLFSYRERIQVNEEYISREAVGSYVERIQQAIGRMQEKGMSVPTVFEVETAMAFLHFVDQGCDLVVLETGMGGDSDATNVIRTSIMEVIVSISKDHTAFLGNTLAEIAGHKAGIIKPGTRVVSARQAPEAMRVIEEKARQCGASLKVADWEQAEDITYGLEEQKFSFGSDRDICIHQGGSYQIKNAVIALNCVYALRELGYQISDAQMRAGFAGTCWNGRFTVLQKNPLVIIDGAHNPDGAAELGKSVRQCLQGKLIYGICGVFRDKDYDKVLQAVLPHMKEVTTIQTPGNPRALPAEELAEAAQKYCQQVHAEKDIVKAVQKAIKKAREKDGVVLVFGSLSFLGEIRKAVKHTQELPMTDLSELRNQIDDIDRQIVELYEKRMAVSSQVAEYKIETGKKVLDKEREDSKLETLKSLTHNDFNRHGIEELFQQIMSMSRKLQYQLLTKKGVVGRLPFTQVEHLEKKNVRVVFQGVEGAYSQAAMKAFFGDEVTSFHVEHWRDALEAISEGMADFAVLPIENSTAGFVSEIYDLLLKYDDYIVGEQIIRIEHKLLGCPGAKLENIRSVFSHEQALMQCDKYLNSHRNWTQTALENTAASAEKVARDQDKSQAAIASAIAGEAFGLDVLDEKICENEVNSTRFIIVSNQRIFEKDAKKISICFELPHHSGSLYNILSHFIYNNLNLSKIESRPLPGRNWEYRFFVDFEGNLNDSAVKNAIRGITEEAANMKILGNY